MKTKFVNKDTDLTTIADETFVYCKELSKGFIKRNFKELKSTKFEDVVNELESKSYKFLEDYKLDSIQFGGIDSEEPGQIEESKKISAMITEQIKAMNFSSLDEFEAKLADFEKKFHFFKEDKIKTECSDKIEKIMKLKDAAELAENEVQEISTDDVDLQNVSLESEPTISTESDSEEVQPEEESTENDADTAESESSESEVSEETQDSSEESEEAQS